MRERVFRIERIEKILDNIFKYPLTIVSAPMGYGKTTAVRTYLNNKSDIQHSWVSFATSGGNEELFWNKIIHSLGDINPEIEIQLNRLSFPLDAKQLYTFIQSIKEIIKNKVTVLVIDDYHIIENDKNIGNMLELVIQEDIPKLYVVLISRMRPKFNHINLVSKGLCYYIGKNALTLTFDEIKDYFKFMNFKVDEDDLQKIYQYTNGWVSAVYLMLLGVKQGFPVNENSNINQLVEENIFFTLNKETQETLLYLSIFNDFTLSQASYVLENPDVFIILDKLLEQNAFLEFDMPEGVYKFHNVLLDYLRRKTHNCNINMSEICYKAGKWYFEQGNIAEAFDYYHRAGKVEELFEQIDRSDFIEISYIGYKLQQKIYSLDKNLCIKFPFLFLQIACNFIVTGEMKIVMQGVEIVNTMKKYFSKDTNMDCDLKNRILGELEVITILIVFNDVQKMVEHAEKAYEFLKGGISCVILKHDEFTFGIPHFLYTYYKEPGKLKETLNFLVDGFPPPIFDCCGYGCELVALAEYALETGNYKAVEQYAQKAKYKAFTKNQVGIILDANFTLMRLSLVEGNYKKAKEILTNTKDKFANSWSIMTNRNYAVYSATLDLMEGYLYGCRKNVKMIPKWLRDGEFESNAFMLNGMAFPCIIYGKSIMLSKNWLKLEVLCESFKESYNIFQNQLGLLHNLIYESVAKYELYGMEEGIKILVLALKSAELDGIMLPFAENCDFILPMLYEIRNRDDIELSYFNTVIEFCESYSKSLRTVLISDEILTSREVQVLKLLEQGLTQRQIANELYVSISTVKRYLESIYEKLGVNNKTIAIKNAKEMCII